MLTYAAFLVLDYFIPMFGVYPVGIDTTYRMGLLAISILNVGIAFLCVGMMHIAGYRWDFYGSDYRTTHSIRLDETRSFKLALQTFYLHRDTSAKLDC